MKPILPLFLLSLLSLVSGCAGTSSGMSTETSVEPASQATAVGDARTRAKVHTELASLYYQSGNMAVALEEIRISLDSDSSYAPAYNVRGLVHMHLRENGAADENFRRALSLAPADPEISNNYGWFLCSIGRERESLPLFATAIKNALYPTPEKSYINAGICSAKMKDYAAAEDFLLKATRYGARGVPALLPLAELNYQRSQFDDAKRQLAEYHRAVDGTAESLWLAVRTERKLGDRAAEASFSAQLRRRFPDSREAQDMKRGKYE